jgi:hypothetical protein
VMVIGDLASGVTAASREPVSSNFLVWGLFSVFSEVH